MKSTPRYFLFKLSVACGLMLGLVLLVESILTYHYVSGAMMRQEARREAERRTLSIERAARLMHAERPEQLAPVLDELVKEAPQQIAWIRVVAPDGTVLADTPDARTGVTIDPARFRVFGDRDRLPEPLETNTGGIAIIAQPFRMPGPPSRGHRQPPPVIEIAIYLDGVSVHYGALRRNLIIGSSAAIALMLAVAIIALRFPHYMRGRRIEQELAVARRVQFDLFPSEALGSRSVDFAAECVPALQVGGDLYDVFESGGGEVSMLLGDVSGKGLPAALLMGVVQGAVRASVISGAASNHEEAADRLNRLLCLKTARERFVSLFWASFDPLESRLTYINAGHLPPLLIRRSEGTTRVERLEEGGPVLGVLPSARYTQAHCTIDSGDLLVVYSDGIVEAANERDEQFGEERIIATILRNAEASPAEICEAILRAVKEFLGCELPQDDQTLMVARMQRLLPHMPEFAEEQTEARTRRRRT